MTSMHNSKGRSVWYFWMPNVSRKNKWNRVSLNKVRRELEEFKWVEWKSGVGVSKKAKIQYNPKTFMLLFHSRNNFISKLNAVWQ